MAPRISLSFLILTVALVGPTVLGTAADSEFQPGKFDWPQWQGKDRDAKSAESGLLDSWPKDGPKLLWTTKNLGGGYSTPSVAAGRIFGMSYRDGKEIVWALKESTGEELWATTTGKTVRVDYGEGPRSTPTVDGDYLYALGLAGDLVCLKVSDGTLVWSKNLGRDFKGKMMSQWGWSESPLVDGDLVLCTPGKEDTIVALEKGNGNVVWKAEVPDHDSAAYSSIIKAELCGKKQYVQFLQKGVVGISDKGKFLWRFDAPANHIANCSTPIVFDDCAFASSAYGRGAGLAKITADQQSDYKAKQVFFNKDMKNHHGGVVLVDGFLYGSSGGNREPREMVCLEATTGKTKWKSEKPGKGAVTFADGHLYYRDESGPMILVEATAKEYVEKGRFDPPDRSKRHAWCHPVIANGKLYLRDQGALHCYDIKKSN